MVGGVEDLLLNKKNAFISFVIVIVGVCWLQVNSFLVGVMWSGVCVCGGGGGTYVCVCVGVCVCVCVCIYVCVCVCVCVLV